MKTFFGVLIVQFIFFNEFVLGDLSNVFDFNLYESVLDASECERQLTYIRNNNTVLGLQFLDASWRLPRSILRGNTRDLGNYFQCLDISENVRALDMSIEGKFCDVKFPLQQDNLVLPELPVFPNITWPETNITWPDLPWPEIIPEIPWRHFDPKTTFFTEEIKAKLIEYERLKSSLGAYAGEIPEEYISARTAEVGEMLASLAFDLAICIPKVCTPRQTLDFLSNNVTNTLDFEENFCRLPNDKKWVAGDTIAVIVLSIIGLITLLSSAYDIRHTILLKRDPKQVNKIYQTFSIYTNAKNFFVFTSSPSAVTCLDGIRSFAMIWVIVGHTYFTQLLFIPENPLDLVDFIRQFLSLWITSGPITVDTFFMLSGLLVVYVSAAKMSRKSLIMNLHLFYLNRILRMLPILGFGILIVASFLSKTVDGPYFTSMAIMVDNCRNNWWSTLLFVQNFVHVPSMCLPHTWYLAIDIHLHIISPIVLFWILGQKKRSAWSAIATSLIAFLVGSTIYNFYYNFQSATVSLARPAETDYFLRHYYVHTLPRASPFFVGMVFGYLLHLYRGKTLKMPMPLVMFFWVLALAGTSAVCMVTYWTIQPDWDNQVMDNIINSYQRPIWAASVGWVIFACHKGYGGPVNWVLSLTVFKILGRLSYAMYILHYPIVFLMNATTLTPIYFSSHFSIYRFFVDFSLTLIAAFLATIIIDFPCTNLIKMGMESNGRQKPQPEKPSINEDNNEKSYNEEKPRIDIESVKVGDENKTK